MTNVVKLREDVKTEIENPYPTEFNIREAINAQVKTLLTDDEVIKSALRTRILQVIEQASFYSFPISEVAKEIINASGMWEKLATKIETVIDDESLVQKVTEEAGYYLADRIASIVKESKNH